MDALVVDCCVCMRSLLIKEGFEYEGRGGEGRWRGGSGEVLGLVRLEGSFIHSCISFHLV